MIPYKEEEVFLPGCDPRLPRILRVYGHPKAGSFERVLVFLIGLTHAEMTQARALEASLAIPTGGREGARSAGKSLSPYS